MSASGDPKPQRLFASKILVFHKTLAAGATSKITDFKHILDRFIKEINIQVSAGTFVLHLDDSFHEILELLDGSEHTINITDQFTLETPDDGVFTFNSPTEWKLVNAGAAEATYTIFFDVISPIGAVNL